MRYVYNLYLHLQQAFDEEESTLRKKGSTKRKRVVRLASDTDSDDERVLDEPDQLSGDQPQVPSQEQRPEETQEEPQEESQEDSQPPKRKFKRDHRCIYTEQLENTIIDCYRSAMWMWDKQDKEYLMRARKKPYFVADLVKTVIHPDIDFEDKTNQALYLKATKDLSDFLNQLRDDYKRVRNENKKIEEKSGAGAAEARMTTKKGKEYAKYRRFKMLGFLEAGLQMAETQSLGLVSKQ